MSQKQDGRNIYAIMKAMSSPVFLVITTMALWQLMLLGTWCKAYYIYVCIYTYIHHKHTYTHIYTLFISIYYIYINYNSKNANAILHSSQKRNKCFFFLVTCYIVETDSKCLLLSWKSYYRNECYCKVS